MAAEPSRRVVADARFRMLLATGEGILDRRFEDAVARAIQRIIRRALSDGAAVHSAGSRARVPDQAVGVP